MERDESLDRQLNELKLQLSRDESVSFDVAHQNGARAKDPS
jgi:hypothetical protein